VEGGLLLDVVVAESASVFELLASKDEALLVRWDAFLVLDFGLHVLNGVALLHIKSDGLASEGLNEDLHATTESEDQVEGGLLLDVVVGKCASVFELLSSKDQALLVRWDAFLVLDLGLDIFNGVGLFDVEGNGLASEGLNENLHCCSF